jgi:phosphate transport system permease protein
MEIMASLPSVVLGFLAALWLAPIVDQRVPSVILIVVGLPAITALFGFFWTRQPVSLRARIRPGREFLLLIPIMLVSALVLWNLGPVLERAFFTVPGENGPVADFRLWWPQATGTSYAQRNSMVVGFMMGFAVIPIVFTIAEDALSNVPGSLTAASAALGASRWQTVRTVVLPIASAGIFSALMIGLGRAVGETMIVVMATGNTPVMDFNIFSGMRTLSANLAVELPEAVSGSTHYRTLFLGALVLFFLTFTLNTVAEILRQHLREKFKIV